MTKKGTRPRRAPRDLSPRARRVRITFMALGGLVGIGGRAGGNVRLDCVEDEDNAALNHVCFVEG